MVEEIKVHIKRIRRKCPKCKKLMVLQCESCGFLEKKNFLFRDDTVRFITGKIMQDLITSGECRLCAIRGRNEEMLKDIMMTIPGRYEILIGKDVFEQHVDKKTSNNMDVRVVCFNMKKVK